MPECEHECVYRMPDAERRLRCGVITHVVRVLHEVRSELAAAKAQIAELTKERNDLRSLVVKERVSTYPYRQHQKLATAVEALGWYAKSVPFGEEARKAIAAIRAPETKEECTCTVASYFSPHPGWDDPNCPVHGRAKDKNE